MESMALARANSIRRILIERQVLLCEGHQLTTSEGLAVELDVRLVARDFDVLAEAVEALWPEADELGGIAALIAIHLRESTPAAVRANGGLKYLGASGFEVTGHLAD
jgi:hypothetical protein